MLQACPVRHSVEEEAQEVKSAPSLYYSTSSCCAVLLWTTALIPQAYHTASPTQFGCASRPASRRPSFSAASMQRRGWEKKKKKKNTSCRARSQVLWRGIHNGTPHSTTAPVRTDEILNDFMFTEYVCSFSIHVTLQVAFCFKCILFRSNQQAVLQSCMQDPNITYVLLSRQERQAVASIS
jgi:hypothetical protein